MDTWDFVRRRGDFQRYLILHTLVHICIDLLIRYQYRTNIDHRFLTAQIIADISKEGFTATAIASAIAFSVGIYSLVVGLLKLGFLLDFISLPLLTGFVGAAGLTILIGQVPALFGETGVGSGKYVRPLRLEYS